MKTNKLEQAVEHTPGPWHIGMKPGPMIYGTKGEQIADMKADLLMDGEREANALLIAAAPELLEALKYLLEEVCKRNGEPFEGATETAERAIRLAEGKA